MNFVEADTILKAMERSRASDPLRRQWLEAAVRYAERRATWWMAVSPERAAMDASRTAAHDAFIDASNILSRAITAAGESNAWRAEIGTERGVIGDCACLLHCVLGLRAR